MPPFAFEAFLFALTFAEDFKGDFRTLNEMAKTKRSTANFLERINEFVRSYSNVKQLSYFCLLAARTIPKIDLFPSKFILPSFRMIKKFENICEVCIFAEILCCNITLCAVMLMIQIEIIVEYIF